MIFDEVNIAIAIVINAHGGVPFVLEVCRAYHC